MSQPIHVNDSDFDTVVLKSSKPILVDFWAEWCGPCKSIGPILEELAKEYDGKVTIAKLDIQENNNTPVKYNVRSIPTLILFNSGEIIDTLVGAVSISHLRDFINKSL